MSGPSQPSSRKNFDTYQFARPTRLSKSQHQNMIRGPSYDKATRNRLMGSEKCWRNT